MYNGGNTQAEIEALNSGEARYSDYMRPGFEFLQTLIDRGYIDAEKALVSEAIEAEGAVTVQAGISGVIQVSQQELQALRQFFEKINGQYQEIVKHIDSANHLGTTKSAMFEDIDNMISQIPPLVSELEAGT